MAQVSQLVRHDPLELRRGGNADEAYRQREPRSAAGAAPRRERTRITVAEHIEPRLDHAGPAREPLERRVQGGGLARQQLARADHAHHDPLRVVEERRREQRDRGAEEDTEAEPAELPPGEAEQKAEGKHEEPGLQDVPQHEEPPAHGARATYSASSRSSAPSSSARPRGGQSG